MSLIKSTIETIAFSFVAYLIHYGINWTVHHFRSKDVFDDFLRFGAEFAFVGLCFFGSAIVNPTSQLHFLSSSQNDLALSTAMSIMLFILFELIAVWFYKTYLRQLRSRGQVHRPQVWRIAISYTFGFVALCASVLLL